MLRRAGIRANRRMGQNFLLDEDIVRAQCELALLEPSNRVLEIGPGLGILTGELLRRSCHVIAVEKDTALFDHLSVEFEDHIENGTLELINRDILKIPHEELEGYGFEKVVANIPYSISSPLLFRLLDTKGWKVGVIMLQEEFAARLNAPVGTAEYSRLTVNTYYRAKVEILRHVAKGCFYPPPRVRSSLVRIRPGKEKAFPVLDEGLFEAVVDALFTQRRKKVRTALVNRFGNTPERKRLIREAAMEGDWWDLRGEDLSPGEIGSLSDLLHELGIALPEG